MVMASRMNMTAARYVHAHASCDFNRQHRQGYLLVLCIVVSFHDSVRSPILTTIGSDLHKYQFLS